MTEGKVKGRRTKIKGRWEAGKRRQESKICEYYEGYNLITIRREEAGKTLGKPEPGNPAGERLDKEVSSLRRRPGRSESWPWQEEGGDLEEE